MRPLVVVGLILGALATGFLVYLAVIFEDPTMRAAFIGLAGTLAAALVAAVVAIVTAWWTVKRQEEEALLERRRAQFSTVRRLAIRYDRHRSRAHELRTAVDMKGLDPTARSSLDAFSWQAADAAEEVRENLLSAIDEALALAKPNLTAVVTQIQDQLQRHKGANPEKKNWIPLDAVDALPIDELRSAIDADLDSSTRRRGSNA